MNHAACAALLTVLWLKALDTEVMSLAVAKGVLPNALDDVLDRAKALFTFTASGELRGTEGMTPHGWLAFVLPRAAPHLYGIDAEPDPKYSDPKPPASRVTARERLDQANGAAGVRF
jgi:hypothetical protein